MSQATWHRVTDTELYYDKSVPFFILNEAMYNLPLGIAGRLKVNPKTFGDSFYLYILTDGPSLDSKPLGAIWWTPPFPLGMSNLTNEEIELFFRTQKLDDRPKALCGPSESIAQFALSLGSEWADFPNGVEIQDQGIYSLSKLTDCFKDVQGQGRVPKESDFDKVLSLSENFIVDCKSTRPQNFEASVHDAIFSGSRVLWVVNGEVVSMAGTAGETPNGSRVAWVYTPCALRGLGYGGAVTRFLTDRQLNHGKKFCFLYTDMANPTSNSIYKKLGYEFVGSSQNVILQKN